MALAFSAFEQPVVVMFEGPGVTYVIAEPVLEPEPELELEPEPQLPIAGVIASFPLYDICWYACAAAVGSLKISPESTVQGTQLLSPDTKAQLFRKARQVFVF